MNCRNDFIATGLLTTAGSASLTMFTLRCNPGEERQATTWRIARLFQARHESLRAVRQGGVKHNHRPAHCAPRTALIKPGGTFPHTV